jgi:hypothetical protein
MKPLLQIKKVSDEGASSPFMARIFMGFLQFREAIYILGIPPAKQPAARQAFDTAFTPLVQSAQATRDAAVEIIRLVSAHEQAIASGHAVRFAANKYEILHNIDVTLGQTFDKMIDQAIVATKGSLQPFLRDVLCLDIGFFFQKDPQFAQGVTDLHAKTENALAGYLEIARSTWHSDLQNLRSGHEHRGWTLPGISYHPVSPQRVGLTLPTVHGLPVNEYARATANRVLLFIENMVVYAMLRKCPYPIFAVEIPPQERDPKNPQRFRFGFPGLDASPPWKIHYDEANDFV